MKQWQAQIRGKANRPRLLLLSQFRLARRAIPDRTLAASPASKSVHNSLEGPCAPQAEIPGELGYPDIAVKVRQYLAVERVPLLNSLHRIFYC
jgi:hypothetical protein